MENISMIEVKNLTKMFSDSNNGGRVFEIGSC